MPVQLKNDRVAFTLVCGHLSSRICLNPDPRLVHRDHLEHPNLQNYKDIKSKENPHVVNGSNSPRTENDSSISIEMEVDYNENQDKTPFRETGTPKTATSSKDRMQTGINTVQRQTLLNQGSVLASDLSIVGFIKLDAIQSPPVLSRHWITLDCPIERDSSVKSSTNDGQPSEKMDGLASVDLKSTKPDESLATFLFPPSPSHQQLNSQSTQRPPQLNQHSYPQTQPSFPTQPLGVNTSHMPKMPPTSSKPPLFNRDGDQQSYSLPTAPQQPSKPSKKSEKEFEPWTREGVPQQHLYSTLHKALDQEAMVAIVALQYPDRNCTRLRKWRRTQDEVPQRGTKQTSTSLGATLSSKRLSHPQGISPNLQSASISDLGSMTSGPAFSSTMGSNMTSSTLTGSSLTGSSVPKDDLSAALTMASLSTVVEADRNWCGLLMVASHFLASPFHVTPVHLRDSQEHYENSEQFVLLILPRNTTATNAPWIPDLNHDKPQFSARVPSLETQFLLPRHSKKSKSKYSKVTSPINTILQEADVSKGMEQFGGVKETLAELQANLTALCSSDDQTIIAKVWDRDLERKIRHNFVRLSSVEAVYGYKSGVNCAVKMLDKALDLVNLESGDGLIDIKMDDIDDDNQGESDRSASTSHQNAMTESIISSNTKDMDANVKVEIQVINEGGQQLISNLSQNPHAQPPNAELIHQGEDHDSLTYSITHNITTDVEETDEKLGGGNVRPRATAKEAQDQLPLEPKEESLEGHIAGLNVEQRQDLKDSIDVVKAQPMPFKHQIGYESESEDIEQDTVMEQSSVPQSRWSSVQQIPGLSHEATSLTRQQLQQKEPAHDLDETHVLSPGLAPQKRRRELRDDGSDDASSVESGLGWDSVIPKTESTEPPTESIMPQIPIEQPGQSAAQLGSKKSNKKPKRIKTELPDESSMQDVRKQIVLPDGAQDAQGYGATSTTLHVKVNENDVSQSGREQQESTLSQNRQPKPK
ncbi:hypothetical protein BGZ46_009898, partial [Entomortierella lignicola]